jgi:histone H3/H4
MSKTLSDDMGITTASLASPASPEKPNTKPDLLDKTEIKEEKAVIAPKADKSGNKNAKTTITKRRRGFDSTSSPRLMNISENDAGRLMTVSGVIRRKLRTKRLIARFANFLAGKLATIAAHHTQHANRRTIMTQDVTAAAEFLGLRVWSTNNSR